MHSVRDPLYKHCRAALRQKRPQTANERAFCEWLSATFDVPAPMFVVADRPDDAFRLWIVFRVKDERDVFFTQTETTYGRDYAKQEAILRKAHELALLDELELIDCFGNRAPPKPWWAWWRKQEAYLPVNEEGRSDLSRWFVSYTAFAPVALNEAISRVPKKELRAFKERFSDAGLWHIELSFDWAIVMFYSEEDRLRAETNGTEERIREAWKEFLRPYDEFGVLDGFVPRVTFDSKEVFDRDFQSSWMRYLR